MREILFRGKRTDNGEWVEGGLLYDEEQNEAYIAEHFEDKHAYFRPIIPETIGEFTGLTDKNGKKIFEGDIVAGWWQECKKNGVVAFRDGSFGLMWHRGKVELFNPFTSMCNVEYEVIGNIHDNPELLNRGEE